MPTALQRIAPAVAALAATAFALAPAYAADPASKKPLVKILKKTPPPPAFTIPVPPL